MRTRILTIVALLALFAGAALADWSPRNGSKMHYPQLPDPNGWDIAFNSEFATGAPTTLADDFRCTSTGPITDVHFWISFRGDTAGLPPEIIQQSINSLKVSFHKDIPAGQGTVPYSMPGEQMWAHFFDAGDPSIKVAGPWQGQQGWYDPVSQIIQPFDHIWYYQVNVTGIPDPFIQTEGEIYWLDLEMTLGGPDGANLPPVGWKTSGSKHFNDDAVYFDPSLNIWRELRDPIAGGEGASLDLAFVITPEPASLVLLAMGGLALARRRRS